MTNEHVEQLMREADDLLDKGKFAASVDVYNKVLEQEPMHDSAYAMLGAVYGELGDIPLAVKSLQKAVEINPANADAWLTLGLIQENTGEDEAKALTSYRNAAQHAPDDAMIHFTLANLLLKNGQTREALSSYLEAVRYNPKHIKAIFTSASLFRDFGDYENAAKGFQAVLDLEPGNLDALRRLTAVLLKLNRLDEADKLIVAAIEDHPNDGWLYARLATVHTGFGRLREALEAAEEARKLEPGNDRLDLIYADVLQRQGDYDKALEVLLPMLERSEPYFEAVMTFSTFAPGIDMQDKALSLIEKVKQVTELTEEQEEHVVKARAWLKAQSA